MPRYRYLLISLAVGAAVWLGFQSWPTTKTDLLPPSHPSVSKIDFAKLEALATKACLCRFVGGDAPSCNKEFKVASANVQLESGATSSVPISGSISCLPSGSPDCFATSFDVVGKDAFVCTNAQADALDAIWSNAQRSNAGSTEKGDRALMAALQRMKRDEMNRRASANSANSN
jgi:hypothetical protein